MQSFRQYLTEAKDPDYFAPWHTKDPAQIETILWSRNSGFTTGKATGYTLNKDGTVSITVENAKFYGTRMKTADNKVVIPFKIKSARQMLTLGSGAIDNLSSLWGAPDKVGTLNVASKELDSLEHLFCDARGTIQLNTPKLTKIENCKFTANMLAFEATNFDYLDKNWMKCLKVKTIQWSHSEVIKLKDFPLLRFKKSGCADVLTITMSLDLKPNSVEAGIMDAFKCFNQIQSASVFDTQDALIKNGFKKYARI